MSVNESLHLCLQYDRGQALVLVHGIPLAWDLCVREPLVATVQQEKVLISKQIK